jgi:hypothetical protein
MKNQGTFHKTKLKIRYNNFRNQTTEVTSKLTQRAANATRVLQQRKILQRNLRHLQQRTASHHVFSSKTFCLLKLLVTLLYLIG